VNSWCDLFSRFVAVGTLSVLVFSAIDYVFSCVQCVLLVDWRYFANVLWCCEFEITPTLFRCVLEFRDTTPTSHTENPTHIETR